MEKRTATKYNKGPIKPQSNREVGNVPVIKKERGRGELGAARTREHNYTKGLANVTGIRKVWRPLEMGGV